MLLLYRNRQESQYILLLYILCLSLSAGRAGSHISLYKVIHHWPVIGLLYNFVNFYLSWMSSNGGIMGKFKNLEVQRFRVWDNYIITVIQVVILNFIFSQSNLFMLAFTLSNFSQNIIYPRIILIFIVYKVFQVHVLFISFSHFLFKFMVCEDKLYAFKAFRR